MIDSALIEVAGGNGGNGIVAFIREAMNPKGGPAGGTGGDGGAVVIVADESESTLLKFRRRRVFRAENGGRGGPNKRYGAKGRITTITVPVGTEVWDADRDELLSDLSSHGMTVVAAEAGRGGSGSARFVSSVNQYPLLAEAGEFGTERRIRLELKLLADVGLVGMPNAGKSSILAAISAARPKIAGYPFTTIEPVLGVVERGLDTMVVVDIPGLIEGAHLGAGLGDEFLKHAERTELLVHVIDGCEEDLAGRVATIDRELAAYGTKLLNTPRVVAVNKMDMVAEQGRNEKVKEEMAKAAGADQEVYFVSAATHEGLGRLTEQLHARVARIRGAGPLPLSEETSLPVFRPEPVNVRRSVVTESSRVFRIIHPRVVRLARGSDLDDWEARVQFHAVLARLGVSAALERLGVASGDTVLVGDWDFEWV